MRIVVFGASGRTGLLLVKQALAKGYLVTALVRDPAKLPIKNDCLELVQGSVIDANSVQQVIAGSQAVVSVIGPAKGSPANLLSVAVTNIIDAMHKEGVRRLISLTGAGVPDPLDRPKLVDQVFRLLLKLPIAGTKAMYQDSIGSVEVIKASNLDWTVVRVPRLTQEPPKGEYQVGYVSKQSGLTIGRADVAEFILKQLTDDKYLQKLPVVSY
jgi:putative NADH-flavin reductase